MRIILILAFRTGVRVNRRRKRTRHNRRGDGPNGGGKMRARLTAGIGPTRRQEILYEPHLIGMSEGRFPLAGFERVQLGG